MYRGEMAELVRLPRDIIELRHRGKRFPLIQWGPFDEGRWNTENDWIGDLNGDGVLDAILDVSPKYTADHWFWFFLSDPARPELGPQLVDRFSGFGCGHI